MHKGDTDKKRLKQFSAPVVVIGAPCGLGAGIAGTELGPAAARLAGFVASLSTLERPVIDHGDLVVSVESQMAGIASNCRNAGTLSCWIGVTHDAVFDALQSGYCPVLIGGDHSLSMGSVSAAARFATEQGKQLHLIWIDAHADFNTPSTSPSGNLHGMSVSFLTGNPDLAMLLQGRSFPLLSPQKISILGARSIDQQEKREIAAAGLNCLDMRAIDEFGVCALIRRVLADMDPENTHLHVSFDMDVMDPEIAPGVGTPVPGGLTYREAHLAMEMLHESGLVGSVDFVELNPMLDHAGRTARLMVDLAGSLFGRTISL